MMMPNARAWIDMPVCSFRMQSGVVPELWDRSETLQAQIRRLVGRCSEQV